MRRPRLGYQIQVNLGRIAALPINIVVYFALGTYSKSIGNAMKARDSGLPALAVPTLFLAGAVLGGVQGASSAVAETVQIMRGKKSRRQTAMIV